MIEVKGLSRYYGQHPAVLDMTFTIDANTIVGFLGLNGAGKSTTLKVLAGLLLPSDGSVRIDGVDLLEAPDSLRSRIGFLPEEPPLYRDMRVADFVAYAGRLKGMSAAEVKARLGEVLALCNVDDVKHRVISELSLGYRKRVGIAHAIIHRPKLVILDEPISGLDPRQISEIRDVIVGLKSQCTVLVSSHILSEVSQTCDRLLVLSRGRLVADGSQHSLAQRLRMGTRLRLTVRGGAEALRQALAAFPSVQSVELGSEEDGLVSAHVALAEDAREALAAHLVHSGLGLRVLDNERSELEDIFLNLTTEARS